MLQLAWGRSAINIRPLPHPITLCTANDSITITEQCDLPGGFIKGALVVKQCAKSLYAAVYACHVDEMGLVIEEGATAARFFRGKITVKELICGDNLLEFHLEPDSDSSEQASVSVHEGLESESDTCMWVSNLLDQNLATHDMIMNSVEADGECLVESALVSSVYLYAE